MRPSFPSRDQLSRLSIQALRVVDVHEKDEEDIVQEILNAKLAKLPQPAKIKLPYVEITTKEQEDTRQKEIDELNEKSRASLLQGQGVEAPQEVVPGELAEPELTPEPSPIEAVKETKRRGRPKKVK